jgi:hypothetical protein
MSKITQAKKRANPKPPKFTTVYFVDDVSYEETRVPWSENEWDEGDSITYHNLQGFWIKKPHIAWGSPHRSESIDVPFIPQPNTPYYVLYAIYSTADSFGHYQDSDLYIVGMYEDEELAKENLKRLEDPRPYLVPARRRDPWSAGKSVYLKNMVGKQTYEFHRPWLGVFNSLGSLHYKKFQLLDTDA